MGGRKQGNVAELAYRMDGVDDEADGHGEVLEGPGSAVRPVDKARHTNPSESQHTIHVASPTI